ncbi:DEAD/DEAH box helicase [Neiella sp. HB171785]|uniref:ATP-dependent RNA helicase RhlE n=1 Tax=Neiella litorisoli TaxID=2771431 RepID=A0A8J6QGF9_9GAMM|nr:DEAD/DEAH box helicase [Neiella litorisoli]MBD1387837.1 DEAD/DEAH box helicase [Neiella litorisoli]
MQFSELELHQALLDAVAEAGYQTPSPIQAQAIPAVLAGHDVMAAAQTGTGKTAGFTLPILHNLAKGQRAKPNHIRALVLTPTRELAAQVSDSVTTYGKKLPLSNTEVFGGVGINPQMMRLRKGIDVLVATPGRLLDLYQQNAVKFSQLEVLVLDEADRMLDMGFIHDIKKILALLPAKRQNLLFSATFSDEIRLLAKGLVRNPVEISVTPRNSTATTVEQWLHPVDKSKKSAVLSKLIKSNNWQQVLIFTRTKHGANRLTKHLEGRGIEAAAIHGNKSQGARTKALADFKSGAVRALVATDIAARGLDIDQLPQVVNFDLPNVAEDYVHRIGRTGRAGANGQAVSLVCADEFKQLSDIEQLTQKLIERKPLAEFEPVHPLPESKLKPPKKPKKPKKPKANKTGDSHQPSQGERHTPSRSGNGPSSQGKNGKGQNGNNKNRPNGNRRRAGTSDGNQPRRPRRRPNKPAAQ